MPSRSPLFGRPGGSDPEPRDGSEAATNGRSAGPGYGASEQKAVVQIRYNYYSNLPFMNDWETAAIAMQGAALILNAAGVVLDLTSGERISSRASARVLRASGGAPR